MIKLKYGIAAVALIGSISAAYFGPDAWRDHTAKAAEQAKIEARKVEWQRLSTQKFALGQTVVVDEAQIATYGCVRMLETARYYDADLAARERTRAERNFNRCQPFDGKLVVMDQAPANRMTQIEGINFTDGKVGFWVYTGHLKPLPDSPVAEK